MKSKLQPDTLGIRCAHAILAAKQSAIFEGRVLSTTDVAAIIDTEDASRSPDVEVYGSADSDTMDRLAQIVRKNTTDAQFETILKQSRDVLA